LPADHDDGKGRRTSGCVVGIGSAWVNPVSAEATHATGVGLHATGMRGAFKPWPLRFVLLGERDGEASLFLMVS